MNVALRDKRLDNPVLHHWNNASSLENVLLMDDSVTVHQRNLQLLMMEMYKAKRELNPSSMKQILEERALLYNIKCSDKL